jgi:hypothetical protein
LRVLGLVWLPIATAIAGACSFPSVTFTSGDAGPRDGSGGDVAGEAQDPCDHDQDGFRATGPPCGGDDCDDYDARAHPGEPDYLTYSVTETNNPLPGDWNCNGFVETEHPRSFTCPLVGTDCSAVGFVGSPQCGTQGTLITCKLNTAGVGCTPDQQDPNRYVGCK